MNQKSNMHVDGESDGRTVPTKCPNKSGKPLAEGMEGRRPTKENIEQTTASQTQSWVNASSGLLGVREAAKQEGKTRFTALLHHVTVALLLDSFYALKRDAAPEWTESRGKSTKQTWINDWRTYTVEYTRERIERNLPREPTSPKQMDDDDPWASQPWRTRSSSTQWLRSSTRSMKRTSWVLLRVPSWAKPASSAGCALGRTHTEESELGA